MTIEGQAPPAARVAAGDFVGHDGHDFGRDFLGHPEGLTVLFATEMWERFSYFGNAALVVLYMVKYLFEPSRVEAVLGYRAVKGGLEFLFGPLDPQPLASQLFGFYTGLAYFMPILGGLLADRVLGHRRAVIIGGALMALGHFMMAFEQLFFFALLSLILGIGAFKPNISTQVGALYPPGDPRRDRAYSIFYIGINIGAFLAPLVCGTLGAVLGWDFGFAAAGVGMLISLAIYLSGARWLPSERDDPTQHSAPPREGGDPGPQIPPFERALPVPQSGGENEHTERSQVIAILLICALVALFWAAYDQQGNTILLWAEDFTDRTVDLGFWRGDIPTPWFLALNPFLIFIFTPLIVRWWTLQSRRGREPFSVTKMALGCLCVALANLVMAAAAAQSAGGKASPLWLVAYFTLVTVGELYVAPVGLALISKVAPARILSMMMGVWFATTLPADILGGWLGGFWSRMAKPDFYLMVAAVPAFAAAAIFMLSRALKDIIER
jgi:POT family proton-dependent oligopeptide transporter